jgi:hypothetical protein
MRRQTRSAVPLFAFLSLLCALSFSATMKADTNAETIWSIGELNDSSIEFAPGWREELTFTIGKSVVSRDFAGHQSGWLGRERPYTIVFDRLRHAK